MLGNGKAKQQGALVPKRKRKVVSIGVNVTVPNPILAKSSVAHAGDGPPQLEGPVCNRSVKHAADVTRWRLHA